MSLYVNAHTNHLRVSKIYKNSDNVYMVKYTLKMECGRETNYPDQESKLSNFMKKQVRCKVCEKRYKEVMKEVNKLNKVK